MRKKNKPKAVLFDFDGTFCNVQPILHLLDHSDPHLTNFHEATVTTSENKKVFKMLEQTEEAGITSVLVSVRGEMWRDLTTGWLGERGYTPEHFHMRRDDDTRPHAEIKREIIRALKEEFDFIAGIDDDPRNTKMFEEEEIASILVPGNNGIDDPDSMEIPDWWYETLAVNSQRSATPALHVPTKSLSVAVGVLCYAPVASAGGAPCILKTPHRGNCRSR